jgi:hypothetical protein
MGARKSLDETFSEKIFFWKKKIFSFKKIFQLAENFF